MKNYLREDLWDFKPYNDNQQEYKYKLDANESPWDLPEKIRIRLSEEILKGYSFNRYPDSSATDLRNAIARHYDIGPGNILVSSGSDELIHILTSAFIDKGDAVICPTPSFDMYKIFVKIAGGNPIEVSLDDDYNYRIDAIFDAIEKYQPKMIFLCTPNNPTGNTIASSDIRRILDAFSGIVVIDEAYIEFGKEGMERDIIDYPNGIVLRTFSKAMGLAGLRIGYSICNQDLASQVYRIKPPYNINTFSQRAALLTLENLDVIDQRISYIKDQRENLMTALNEIDGIQIYSSEANFILIRVPDGDGVYKALLKHGILVRNFPGQSLLENCLRVTVGDGEANHALCKVLKEVVPPMIF